MLFLKKKGGLRVLGFLLGGGGVLAPPLQEPRPPLEIWLAIFFFQRVYVMDTELKINTRNIQHMVSFG